MNRMIVGVSAALLLSGMVLHAAPAQATAYVDCSGLKLTKASGVPGSSTHNYAFKGTCKLDDPHPKKGIDEYTGVGAAVASARWDGNSRTFTEHVYLPGGADTDKISHGGGLFYSTTNVDKGPHVGTGAEDATFNCNEDPVIHKNPICTLVSHSNATGWGNQNGGFGASASIGMPLLQGMATVSQARALSKHNTRISCNGLRLTAATGVPGGKKRTYKFNGTCELYHTLDGNGGLQVTKVLATGSWDAIAQQAEEGVTVLTKPNEGGGGWSTKYTCTDDPWLNHHAKCSKTFQLGKTPRVYDPITDILDRHPITMGLVNGKQATLLSEKSHHPKTTAHVGKKHGPSLANRGVVAGSAHSNMGNLHIGTSSSPRPKSRIAPNGIHLSSSSPARPGTMQAQPRLKLPAANVRVLGERTMVDRSCRDTHKLIVIDATVRNDGGPLGVHKWELFVMEGGGAGLSSGGVWVPPLAPHARAHVSIPVLVLKSHIAQLPGTHWLKLISEGHGGHKTTTTLSPITLARGICQPRMRMSSPAGMHLQMSRPGYPPSPCVGAKCQQAGHPQPGTRMSTPNTKLNPQPEPPSAKQRLRHLPAVQFK